MTNLFLIALIATLTILSIIILFFIYCVFDHFLNAPQESHWSPEDLAQPYIINVENLSSKNLKNFRILKKFETYKPSEFDDEGNYKKDNVTISSGTSGLNFNEILYYWSQNPFRVGLVYFLSSKQSQVLESATIRTKIKNKINVSVLTPVIDPYQQRENVVPLRTDFEINDSTTFTIKNLLGDCNLRLMFYPHIPKIKRTSLWKTIKKNIFKSLNINKRHE